MNEVTSLNFSTKGEKVEDSDFVKIFLRMEPNWKNFLRLHHLYLKILGLPSYEGQIAALLMLWDQPNVRWGNNSLQP